MSFRIKSIILWPKNSGLQPRVIDFDITKVNVITGSSGKGKSSIMYIIDYCLGSGRSLIPSGLIRNVVTAFGIILKTESREILLARESPGFGNISNNFFKLEDEQIVIPDLIPEYQLNVEQIKLYLNSLLAFADIGMESNDYVQSYGTQKPSYRNALSLNYQPQYLVANQTNMFYRADSTVHREKLKILFPYLIGAIDNRILELKEELKALKKKLNVLIKDKDAKEHRINRITNELRNYFRIGQEFGLINSNDQSTSVDQDYLIERLNNILEYEVENVRIPNNVTEKSAEQLFGLTKQEQDASDQLQDLGRRLSFVRSIQSGNKEIGDSTITKRSRLSAANWLKDKLDYHKPCPLCDSIPEQTKTYTETLSHMYSRLENVLEKVSDSAKIYMNERRRLEKEISNKELQINAIRDRISALKRDDGEFKRLKQNQNAIYRYLGQVELSLNQFYEYNSSIDDGVDSVTEYKSKIEEIEKEVSSDKLKARERYAIKKISDNIQKYANLFEAENSQDNIVLDINEYLTLKFNDSLGREKLLWEVGSGHNYMAYHLATYLGLHEYLITLSESKIPPFIIFDQPSQAYFPEIKGNNSIQEEDILKSKKIFEVLSAFNIATEGKIQIILLEHAGEDSWKGLDNVVKTKRWRSDEEDDALIPKDWIN